MESILHASRTEAAHVCLAREAPGHYEDWRRPEGYAGRLPDGMTADAFSAHGLERFEGRVEAYARTLANLSKAIAERASADSISAHHVARADDALSVGERRGIRGLAGTAGGFLSSAGIGMLVAWTTSSQVSPLVYAGALTLAVGFALTTYWHWGSR